MKLYLITKSNHYYPFGGSSDFQRITADEDEAHVLDPTWDCGNRSVL